jgi:hypothetical protein
MCPIGKANLEHQPHDPLKVGVEAFTNRETPALSE